MRVMAFDPGVTTGVALVEDERYTVYQVDSRNLDTIWTELDTQRPTEVAYEDFKHRPTMLSAELYSLQVIGVIRLWCSESIECRAYLPARVKAFWDNAKVKKLGLWKPGQPHAMDALRVLLTHKAYTDVDWFKKVLTNLQ
jgi:hypothetical protein